MIGGYMKPAPEPTNCQVATITDKSYFFPFLVDFNHISFNPPTNKANNGTS